jgi:peptide/nickel transport system permease protein
VSIFRLTVRRLARLILTVWIASTAVFFLLRVIPGDPARIIAGIDGASDPQVLSAIRSRLGLDRSIAAQYGDWMMATFTLDFGESYQKSRPVMALIRERLGLTLSLAFGGMAVALLVAVPAGVYSARKRDALADHLVMGSAHVLLAIPEFWLGIVLLLLFSVYLPLFPLFGSDTPAHLVLPSLALGLGRAAFLARLVRTAVIRELDREYVLFLRQLGVPGRRIMLRHILPNALIPVAIPGAIQFGYLLGGAIIIEQVFGMGGTGRLLLQAIQSRDFPVIQGGVIVLAVIFSLVNFSADLLTAVADPRSRI